MTMTSKPLTPEQLADQLADQRRANLVYRRLVSSEAWGAYGELIKVLAPEQYERGQVPEWGFLLAKARQLREQVAGLEAEATELLTKIGEMEAGGATPAPAERHEQIRFVAGNVYEHTSGKRINVLAEQGSKIVITTDGGSPDYHAPTGRASEWSLVDGKRDEDPQP